MAHLYNISKPHQPVAHESAAVAAWSSSDVILCIIHCWPSLPFLLVECVALRYAQFALSTKAVKQQATCQGGEGVPASILCLQKQIKVP
jgi:hypothetical protein